jgi:hypothetical protein
MQIQQQKYSEHAQLVRDNKTGQYLNYRQLIRDPKHKEIWSTSAANKFGRLAQGVASREKRTNTIFFIHKDQVPKDRIKDVTYGSCGYEIKPNKEEKHCTQLTAGGDRIHYPDNVGTPTANMTLVKVLLNSIISTENAQCVILEVKDFYLNTPMKRFEYMRLKLNNIPEEIIIKYKLHEIATKDGYVYCKKRNVWLTSSGNNRAKSSPGTLSQSGVSSEQNYTWLVDTRNKEVMLHISC